MLKFKEYFYERNDYNQTNNVLILADKIIKYFSARFGRISQYSINDRGLGGLDPNEHGYYFHAELIDKRLEKLFICLHPVDEDNPTVWGGHSEDEDGSSHVIILYILTDIEAIDNPNLLKVLKTPKINNVLVHELTHFFDALRYKGDRISNKMALRQSQMGDIKDINNKIKYLNLPEELNAHWQTASAAVLKMLKKNSSIWNNLEIYGDEFQSAMIYELGDGVFDNLTDDNKKRTKKRIYAYWQELIDVKNKKIDVKTRRVNKQYEDLDEGFSIDAFSDPYSEVLYEIPISVNPNKTEFTNIMRSEYSKFGSNYKGIRAGFVDGDLYVWPCNVYHVDMIDALKKFGFVDKKFRFFDFPFIYSKNEPEKIYTDWIELFMTDEDRKKFIDLTNKRLSFLTIEKVMNN